MRAKKAVIIFLVIVLFVKFSWDIFTAFIPSGFEMLELPLFILRDLGTSQSICWDKKF